MVANILFSIITQYLVIYTFTLGAPYLYPCATLKLSVMVIVAGIGHGDTSSNPGLNAFHIALIPLGKVLIQLFSLQLWVNSRAD